MTPEGLSSPKRKTFAPGETQRSVDAGVHRCSCWLLFLFSVVFTVFNGASEVFEPRFAAAPRLPTGWPSAQTRRLYSSTASFRRISYEHRPVGPVSRRSLKRGGGYSRPRLPIPLLEEEGWREQGGLSYPNRALLVKDPVPITSVFIPGAIVFG